MPKVSVIIPIYKVAKYVEKCCRSLFEQTLDEIEYLFIDDCTPDDSIEIIKSLIDEYKYYFKRMRSSVRIFSMPSNSGQAAVRRKGIISATGDFVIHCDGDDWVDTDLYEKMYNEAVSSGADMVFCDLVDVYNYGYQVHRVREITDNGKGLIRNIWADCLHLSCCNKLIKTSIMKEHEIYPIPGINMWEDNCLISRVLYYADKVSQVRNSYYYYNRTNEHSISANYGGKAVNEMQKCADVIADFFKSKPDANDFINTVHFYQYLAKLNLVTDSFSRLKLFYKLYPESNRIASILDPQAFSVKGRVRYYMVRYHFAWLFVLMFKVKNVIIR